MRRILAILLALLAWAAIFIQYDLMMQNRVTSKLESTIRFFSFFTILTNIIVAIFFTTQSLKLLKAPTASIKGLTPVTIYITIVGLVYQILLRHVWNPTGLQMIVDELLHSVIPVLTILYWYVYAPKAEANYKQMLKWMIYPLVYLIYTLIRGSYSGFYPYPFVNVTNLGMQKVLINAVFILIGFIIISILFIRLKKINTIKQG